MKYFFIPLYKNKLYFIILHIETNDAPSKNKNKIYFTLWLTNGLITHRQSLKNRTVCNFTNSMV